LGLGCQENAMRLAPLAANFAKLPDLLLDGAKA
jgi:hypothetical protein